MSLRTRRDWGVVFHPGFPFSILIHSRTDTRGFANAKFEPEFEPDHASLSLPVCGELLILGKSVIRHTHPKQPIPKTKARATSSAALEHGDLIAQRDRFQRQRGAGLGFAASGDRERFACRHPHERRLSPDVRIHQ